jgi:diguanylate cyclase (GGDEF)-like protein
LAQVRDLADRDGLTGLLNRRAFHVALDGAIGRVSRYAEHGTVLMIDLDKFKAINDTHGHAVGDEFLRRVGEALRSLLRNSDVCGRLGGDEFAVILPHTGVAEAEIVAEKLRGAIRSIALGAPRVHAASASIGIAELGPDANLTAAEVLLRADMAMYQAKHGGRDRTAVASPTSAPGLALVPESGG